LSRKGTSQPAEVEVLRENASMTTKLNVQFNDRQSKSLENMAEEMGTTRAGVLKTALALLEVAIRERKEGNAIGVVKGDKVVKEIVGIE
jgi:hypothetical protein